MTTAPIDVLGEGLRSVLGASVIDDLRRVSGGASRETWTFRADGEPLVLQRVRAGTPGGLRAEPSVLGAAHRHGVPVPEMIVDGSGSAALERPFMIVRHVDGETIARKILRDDRFARARESLPAQLGRAAALVHSIPVDDAPGLAVEDQIARYRTVLDDLGEPHPVFEIAFRWLESHRPSPSVARVVHGDYRLGNVMVSDDGLAAILDWELAHLGDPMEDLGWLCVRAWRFGGALPVAGLGTVDELLDAYADIAGERPDPRVVRWWEILGTVKWGIMCIVQARAHLSGMSRSHELAAIGRRVCENEYDLLELLDEELSASGGSR